jgi:alpha-mannosidase
MRLPAGRRDDDEGHGPRARAGRGAGHVETTITVRLSLDAGASFVRIAISGENRARDHRLRCRFATGIADPEVRADAAFGPVVRRPPDVPLDDRIAETPPPTAPLHRYVTLYDQQRGATLYSDGLAEYEAAADGSIAVTLVRAVGELSRNDLPERPGHAGWPAPVPEAQSLGPFVARFALLPHSASSDATVDEIERVADDVLLPLVGETLRSALAIPEPTSGVELEGTGLAFSCAKPSESGEWLVLRCVNLTDTPVHGRWVLGRGPSEARLSRLDEAPGESIAPSGDGVAFEAGPRAVVTILVR